MPVPGAFVALDFGKEIEKRKRHRDFYVVSLCKETVASAGHHPQQTPVSP